MNAPKRTIGLFIFLIAIQLIPTVASQAQEADWLDNLQMKEAQRKELRKARWNKFFNKGDTTKIYEPSPTVGMQNHYMDNPAFCGFEQRPTVHGGFLSHNPCYINDSRSYLPYEYFYGFDCSSGGKRKLGWGAAIWKRQAGTVTFSGLDQSLSYKIRFSKYSFLRIGITMQYYLNSLNFRNIIFPDMMSNNHGVVFNTWELHPGELSKKNLNFHAGLLFNRKNLYAGFAVQNITKPDYGFISQCRMQRSWNLTAGHTLKINRVLDLSPSAQLRYQGRISYIDLHLVAYCWKRLLAGISLTENKNLSVDLGFTLPGRLMIIGSCGISTESELYHHFGPLAQASCQLRWQLGKYQPIIP